MIRRLYRWLFGHRAPREFAFHITNPYGLQGGLAKGLLVNGEEAFPDAAEDWWIEVHEGHAVWVVKGRDVPPLWRRWRR